MKNTWLKQLLNKNRFPNSDRGCSLIFKTKRRNTEADQNVVKMTLKRNLVSMKLFVRFERRVIRRFREIWILSNWYDTRLQFSDMQMNAYQFNQDEIL